MGFLKRIFSKKVQKNRAIYIVSGLPRSGTSMMMKMLDAGGMPLFIDNIRLADENNPKGYYEYERVKRLPKDNAWVSKVRGRAIKVISMLLYHLPQNLEYKIIFMQRDMGEILASQRAMLEREQKNSEKVMDELLMKKFSTHLDHVYSWLDHRPGFNVIFVNYNTLLSAPHKEITAINNFAGGMLDEKKMLETIDVKLYRQRKSR